MFDNSMFVDRCSHGHTCDIGITIEDDMDGDYRIKILFVCMHFGDEFVTDVLASTLTRRVDGDMKPLEC